MEKAPRQEKAKQEQVPKPAFTENLNKEDVYNEALRKENLEHERARGFEHAVALALDDEVTIQNSKTEEKAVNTKIDSELSKLNELRSKFNMRPIDTTVEVENLRSKIEQLKPAEQKSFERPEDDPVIREVERSIEERTTRELRQYLKGQWGTIAEKGARRGEGGSSRSQVEERMAIRAWGAFLDSNPDIAKKYRGRFKEIDKAFERKERK